MVEIGTPNTTSATRLMLLGSGELGREVAIEAMRLGVEVIAVDRYPGAPAMQVAHRSHVVSMLDGPALRQVVEFERPHFVVPEIEAIATQTLEELEREGYRVVPTARAARLTMNREGIRRLAAEELGIATSRYAFAATLEEYEAAVAEVGFPCVIKPVMSSSGKGQSVVRSDGDIGPAWRLAQEGGRGGRGKVIVESFVEFDYEVTQLTVRHAGGTSFCDPIGHYQVEGDYRRSWQPQPMTAEALAAVRDVAARVTEALGGWGIFGVELFVREARPQEGMPLQVLFSEVSPRPHDTGLVTCLSQDLSEFALHVRAILGLPIPGIRQRGPAASAVILAIGQSRAPAYGNIDEALAKPDTAVMLFGKPLVAGRRRMGVAIALGGTLDEAKEKAEAAAAAVTVRC